MTSSLLAAVILTGANSVNAETPATDATSVAPISERRGRISVAAQYSGTITPKLVQERGAVVSAHYSFTEIFRVGLLGGFFETGHTAAGHHQWLQLPRDGTPPVLRDLYALRWMVAADAQLTAIHGQLKLGTPP